MLYVQCTYERLASILEYLVCNVHITYYDEMSNDDDCCMYIHILVFCACFVNTLCWISLLTPVHSLLQGFGLPDRMETNL